MNVARRIAVGLAALVAVGVVAWAPGRELRVPAQYPTIQAAIEAAQDGDTILIAPGTYRENLTVAKRVTLVGTDRDTVILDGSGSDVVTVSSGGALVLASLTVTNGREGVSVRRGGQVRIEGCRIAGNARDGVLAIGTAELLGNVIRGNGRCGVNAFGSDAKVTGTGNLLGGNAGGDLCGDVPPGLRAEGGPPAPVVRVTPDGWTNRNEFTLTWEKPVYPAAIVAAWYKLGAAPAGPEDGTRTTAASLTLGSPSEGRQPVYLWLEDELGQKSHRNAAQVALLWDKTPPTITPTIDPRPNANGWNNAPVTVTFRAEDPHSRVASLTPPDPVRLTSEGKDQVVKATAVDHAGNRSELTVTVHIDLTKPKITVGGPQGTAGADGWYRSAVTVPYTATDALSGFTGGKTRTEGTVTTSGEGADLRVTIRVADLAGNTAEATAGPFKVDTTPPVVKATPPDATRWYREDVSVPCTATDALSGLASAGDASFTLLARGEGASVSTGTRTVSDKAGNTTTVGPYTFQIDKTPPTGSLKINDGAATTASTTVNLTITAADALSGVAEMRFSNDGSTWSDWEPFKTSRPNWDLTLFGGSRTEGTKTVHAQLRDRAGNASASFSASIAYAAPAVRAIRIAVLDESRTPGYFTGGNQNYYDAVLSIARARGLTAERITSADIAAGRLDEFTTLVLPDNAPPTEVVDRIVAWWSRGNHIIALDSGITFVLYSGILFPELKGRPAGESKPSYWTYDSGSTVVIKKAHPITAGHSPGQELPAESDDALLVTAKLPIGAEVLAVDKAKPDQAAVVFYQAAGALTFIGPDGDANYLKTIIGNAMAFGPTTAAVLPEGMLAWIPCADEDEEYAHVVEALGFRPLETKTRTASELRALLAGVRVLLIPEQEKCSESSLESLGRDCASVLREFLDRGGIIVGMSHEGGFWSGAEHLLRGAGILPGVDDGEDITGETVWVAVPGHPLAAGVASSFIARNGSTDYSGFSAAATVVVKDADGDPVVFIQAVGRGTVIMLGFDFYEYNADMARLLRNAVGLAVVGIEGQIIFQDDFETCDFSRLPWKTTGKIDRDERRGKCAVELGPGQYLELTYTVPEGTITFWRNVDSGEGTLIFLIDGREIRRWSGEGGEGEDVFVQESFAVAAGTHTFRWEGAVDCCPEVDDIVYTASTFAVGSAEDVTTIVKYLPATYEFSNQDISYHMVHFTDTQPSGTVILGRSCEGAANRNVLLVRSYPGGGTFTYMAFDLGMYGSSTDQAAFVNPFLRGFLEYIEALEGKRPSVVLATPHEVDDGLYIKRGLEALGVAFSEASSYPANGAADVIIIAQDGGLIALPDYTEHLRLGHHVLVIGGSNHSPYYESIKLYFNITTDTGWHKCECTPDWIRLK